MGSSSTCQ